MTREFELNQTMWLAGTKVERVQHECPDCKGIGHWTVTTPAASTFKIDCVRCKYGYFGGGVEIPSLSYNKHVRDVIQVFCASRIETGTGFSYEWRRVGSSNGFWGGKDVVKRLYETEAGACIAADAMAEAENNGLEEKPAAIEREYFSKLQINFAASDAIHAAGFNADYHASCIISEFENAIEKDADTGREIDTMEEAIERVQELLTWNKPRYHFERLPLRKLVQACMESDDPAIVAGLADVEPNYLKTVAGQSILELSDG